MAEEALVPVYQAANVGRAEVIRSALEDAGIHCAIENELQAGFSGVLQCRLLVLQSDVAAAQAFINEHEAAAR